MPAVGPIIAAAGSILGGNAASRGAANAANAEVQNNREGMGMQLQMFNTIRGDNEPWRQVGVGALNQLAELFGIDPVSSPSTGELTMQVNGAYDNPRGWDDHFADQLGIPGVGSIRSPLDTLRTPFRNFGDWDGSRMADNPGTVSFANKPATTNQTVVADRKPVVDPFQRFRDSTGYQFRLNQGLNAIDNSAASRGGALSGRAIKEAERYGQGFASNEFGNYVNQLAGLAGIGQIATTNNNQYAANTGNSLSNMLSESGRARGSGYINQANAMSNMFNNLGQIGANYYYGRGG